MVDNTAVFIDNAYLKLIAKHFVNSSWMEKKYDTNQLAITFCKEQGLWCERVYFYTAPPYQSSIPTEDEKVRKAKYDTHMSHLNRIPTFTIREGRCQKTGNPSDPFHQKGVDTLMVMDLTQFPEKHKGIKSIIVITSDTDFVPVLNHLRENHEIRVILYYYSDLVRNSKFSMSNHLFQACDKKVLIKPEYFKMSQYNGKPNL